MTPQIADQWPRIVIVGAGISGICAGIRIIQAGFTNLTILEKEERLGGTWRDNIYPGAACDVPSHLYSYSFAAKADWSRIYASQPEILAYLEDCVGRFGLARFIRYGADVCAARYIAPARSWRIELSDGESIDADILIVACGQLHKPLIPEIPGRESFAGVSFHSARWRCDHDLSGREVALIGSAASAVQIAPAIVREVRRLKVFQRSPNWVAPRFDRAYSRFELALLRRAPFLRRLHRALFYWAQEALILAFRPDSVASRVLTWAIRRSMRIMISNDAMVDRLTPGYPLGCKRILMANDYLSLFRRRKVSLITEEISHIVPDGIVACDGATHHADTIVYATGFAGSEFLAPMEVVGVDDAKLAEAWQGGAEAYLGMTVPRFPNFFILYGPNTGLGHNSIIFMVERQVGYVVDLLKHMRQVGATEAAVHDGALRRFSDRLQRHMDGLSWASDCGSWYKNANGRVVTIWPYSTLRFWWATRRPRLADYAIR